MSRSKVFQMISIVVFTFLLAACAPAGITQPQSPSYGGNLPVEPTETESAGSREGVKVSLTGAVAEELRWSEAELRTMDTIESQAANSQGEQDTYTGVPINDLLAAARPQSGATSITFRDSDGNSAEFPLEQILNCADCILSFRTRGGFSVVIPGNNPDLPIRGVVIIEIQ